MDIPGTFTAYDFCARILALTDYDVGPLIEEAGGGECEWLEFKRQSEPPATGPEPGEKPDDYRWHVARAVIAMANSGGGCVLLGLEDDGTPVGLGPSDPKDYLGSTGRDSYLRHFLAVTFPLKGWDTKKGDIKVDAPRYRDLLRLEPATLDGQEVLAMMISPLPEGDDLLPVTKSNQPSLPMRQNGALGQVSELVGAEDIHAYRQRRTLHRQDLKERWDRFSRIYQEGPVGLEDRIREYRSAFLKEWQIHNTRYVELEGEETSRECGADLLNLPEPIISAHARGAEADDPAGLSWRDVDDLHSPRREPPFSQNQASAGPIREVLNRQTRSILLGEPGGGKTTSLVKMALSPYSPGGEFSVFVRLSEYQRPGDLIPLVIRTTGLTEHDLEWLLKGSRLRLLLDGLNECPGEFRNDCASEINALSFRFPLHRHIVSSRSLGWKWEIDEPTFQVLPLTHESRKEYVRTQLGKSADAKLAEMMRKIESVAERGMDVDNPMLLMIAVKVFRANPCFPESPALLYKEFLRLWMEREQDKHGRARTGTPFGELPPALHALAFHGRMRGRRVIPKDEAIEVLSSLTSSPEEFLQEFGSGFPLRITEEGADFRHEADQEYLAAEFWRAHPDALSNEPELDRQAWGMVLVNAVQLGPLPDGIRRDGWKIDPWVGTTVDPGCPPPEAAFSRIRTWDPSVAALLQKFSESDGDLEHDACRLRTSQVLYAPPDDDPEHPLPQATDHDPEHPLPEGTGNHPIDARNGLHGLYDPADPLLRRLVASVPGGGERWQRFEVSLLRSEFVSTILTVGQNGTLTEWDELINTAYPPKAALPPGTRLPSPLLRDATISDLTELVRLRLVDASFIQAQRNPLRAAQLSAAGHCAPEDFSAFLEEWGRSATALEAVALVKAGICAPGHFEHRLAQWVRLVPITTACRLVYSRIASPTAFSVRVSEWVGTANPHQTVALIRSGICKVKQLAKQFPRLAKVATPEEAADLIKLKFCALKDFKANRAKWLRSASPPRLHVWVRSGIFGFSPQDVEAKRAAWTASASPIDAAMWVANSYCDFRPAHFSARLSSWKMQANPEEAAHLVTSGICQPEDFHPRLADWKECSKPTEAAKIVTSGICTAEAFATRLESWIASATPEEALQLIDAGIGAEEQFSKRIPEWLQTATPQQATRLLSQRRWALRAASFQARHPEWIADATPKQATQWINSGILEMNPSDFLERKGGWIAACTPTEAVEWIRNEYMGFVAADFSSRSDEWRETLGKKVLRTLQLVGILPPQPAISGGSRKGSSSAKRAGKKNQPPRRTDRIDYLRKLLLKIGKATAANSQIPDVVQNALVSEGKSFDFDPSELLSVQHHVKDLPLIRAMQSQVGILLDPINRKCHAAAIDKLRELLTQAPPTYVEVLRSLVPEKEYDGRLAETSPACTIYIDETWPMDRTRGVITGLVWWGSAPNPDILPQIPQHLWTRDNFVPRAVTAIHQVRDLSQTGQVFPFIFENAVPAGTNPMHRYEKMIHDAVLILLGWLLPRPADTVQVHVVCEAMGGVHTDGTDQQREFHGRLSEAGRRNPDRFNLWKVIGFEWRQKRSESPVYFSPEVSDAQGYLAYADLLAYLSRQESPSALEVAQAVNLETLPGWLRIDENTVDVLQTLPILAGSDPGKVLDFLGHNHRAPRMEALLDSFRGTLAGRPDIQASLLRELERRYRNPAVSRLDLAHQVEAVENLTGEIPADTPRQLRLLAMGIHLQKANHFGDPARTRELEKDYKSLRQIALDNGDAELVAEIDLRLAERSIDLFDPELALGYLMRLRTAEGKLSLLALARLSSFEGQCLSFAGEFSQAHEKFDQALGLIERTDLRPKEKLSERKRTATYRALNAIDSRSADATKLTLEAMQMEGIDSLEAAATRFSGPSEIGVQFEHRLFLRLLHREKDLAPLRLHYLHGCDATAPLPAQHPWESIALHRGLLASEAGDADAAAEWYRRAVEITVAPHHGDTVRFIGAVIAAVAWTDTEEAEFRDALVGILDGDEEWGGQDEELVSKLPALEDRIATLRDIGEAAPSEDPDAVERLLSLLPLNHR